MIDDGTIVFLTFDIGGNASAGVISLTFSNIAAAAPDASPINLTGANGSITIGATTFVDVPRAH